MLLQEFVFLPFISSQQVQPAKTGHPSRSVIVWCPERLLPSSVVVLIIQSDCLTNLPGALSAHQQWVHLDCLSDRRTRTSLSLLQLVFGRKRHFIVVQLQGQDRFKPRLGFGRFVFRFGQCDPFSINQFPVLGLISCQLFHHGHCLRIIFLIQHRIQRFQHRFRILFFHRDPAHQRRRFVILTQLHQQLSQSRRGFFSRRRLHQLLLELHCGIQITIRFTQLDQLSQKLNIAGIFSQQLFQFLTRVTVIAGRLVGLGEADRHFTLLVRFTTLTFKPFEQPIKLVCL